MLSRPWPIRLKCLPIMFLSINIAQKNSHVMLNMLISSNRLLYHVYLGLSMHVTDYSVEGDYSIRVFRSFSVTW